LDKTTRGAGIKGIIAFFGSIRFQVVFFLLLFIIAGSFIFRYVASNQARNTLQTERTEKVSDIASRLPQSFLSKLTEVINQYKEYVKSTHTEGSNFKPTLNGLDTYIDLRLPGLIDDLATETTKVYETSSIGYISINEDGNVVGAHQSYQNNWYPRLVKLQLSFPPLDPFWTLEPVAGIKSWVPYDPLDPGWHPPELLAYAAQSYEGIDSDLASIERSIDNPVWITLISGTLIALFIGLSLSARLIKVKKGIASLATDLSRPVPVVSGELGVIASAANQLALDLLKSRSRSERVLESVTTGIVVVDSNLKIIQANPSSLQLVGLSTSEALGKEISVLGEIAEIAIPEIQKAVLHRSVWNSGSVKVKVPSGSKYVSMRVIPVKLGVATEAILVIQDVTESVINTLESERKESLARLGMFTMGVAHEVRNPLTSIKGFVQLLDRKLIGRDESRYLTPVMREVERLELMITDLLESSRPGPVKKSDVELGKFIDEVLASQASKLSESDIQIKRNYMRGIISQIDQKRMHQVILNLILNAKDAMSDGGILTLKTYTNDSWDFIEVNDTGHGISEIDAGKIFTPFFTTKASGTGLGLSICDQIVKSHGGTISFTSDMDGTIFTIRLPKSQKAEV